MSAEIAIEVIFMNAGHEKIDVAVVIKIGGGCGDAVP